MKKRAFRGDETPAEERAEAKAVKKGSVTPAQYAKKEKAESEKGSEKSLKARGEKLKSGELSDTAYAAMDRGGKVKKMAGGGKVKRMADGGRAGAVRGGARFVGNSPFRESSPRVSNAPVSASPVEPADRVRTNMPMVNRPLPGAAAPVNFVPDSPRSSPMAPAGYKKGGKIDGAAIRGKTKGRIK